MDSINRNQHPEGYQHLAECYLFIKDYEKACQFANECLNRKESDPDVHNLMGLSYFLKVCKVLSLSL